MINQIIDAISVAIAEEFGDDYNIYDERINQELEEPCFFIHLLNGDHELFLNQRYYRQNHFDVQYFPGSSAIQRECNDVGERLSGCLEYITLYDANAEQDEVKPIRGGSMHYEIKDDVLHFFVDYNGFLKKQITETEMKTLSQQVDVKE